MITPSNEERREVHRLRKKREWTQEQLADKAGCSPGTISNIETGRHPQVAQVVFVEVMRVLKGVAADEADGTNERFKRVVDKFQKLERRDQVAVEGMIDTLLQTPNA